MRRRSLIGLVLAGGLGLAACAAGPSVTTSTTGAEPATTSAKQVLRVAPAADLHNGEVVHVRVSGFPAGKVFLSECAAAADVNPAGCGAQLAAQPFVEVEYVAGAESFRVSDRAPSTALSPEPSASCAAQCVLVATSGVDASGLTHIATAKLAFGH